MNWVYAAHPDPNISRKWDDEAWPPSEWYDVPDLALGELDSLWQFDDLKAAKALTSQITEEQFLLWAVVNIVGQICNGGFSQALYNSYGQLAEEAITGLKKFGFVRHAQILDDAWTLFGIRPIPREREVRIERLELLANINAREPQTSSFIEHASSVFQGTAARWDALESEFFELLHAKTHGDGYNAAYYRPLAEWIYNNRNRFFVP